MPVVPPVFRWKFGGHEIVVIYEETYGGVTRLPGGRALSVNLTGDNHGPQNPSEINKVYARLAEEFPGARIQAGSLNRSAAWLWKNRASLPAVEREIGDTWIHGVGTDPGKVSAFRQLCRLRSQWVAEGRLTFGSKTDFALGGNLLLVAGHTWGMDIKSHLKDWKHYLGDSFRKARRTRPFRLVEKGACWLHATDGEIEGPGCRISSPDAALIAPDLGRLLIFRQSESRFRQGVSFNLYNNVWGTNFPMWSEEDAVFRFRLETENPMP